MKVKQEWICLYQWVLSFYKVRFHPAVRLASGLLYETLGKAKLITGVCFNRLPYRYRVGGATWHRRNATQCVPLITSRKKPSRQTKETNSAVYLTNKQILFEKRPHAAKKQTAWLTGKWHSVDQSADWSGSGPLFTVQDSSGWYPEQRGTTLTRYGSLLKGTIHNFWQWQHGKTWTEPNQT